MRDLSELQSSLPPVEGIKTSLKVRFEGKERTSWRYLDIPICFDSETYSFKVVNDRQEQEKRAVMWAWGLAIGDECYMGRTWSEFVKALDIIREAWGITPDTRMIVWVHNLSYDFQFFRKWFKWTSVFALKSREVCYALTDTGIEFRCSYILTGYGLEKVGEHLTAHNIRKLAGTIDYDIPRHPGSKLTDEEVLYLEHDCLVVTAHIEEQIEKEGGLAKIPLTKTGYVRRDVKNACFRDPEKKASQDMSKIRYGAFIRGMELDPFIYESLQRAFAGGFTHANPFHSGEVMENVASYDFASAYPSVMCSELYPVTPPQIWEVGTDVEEFYRCLRLYCCVFTVQLIGVEPKVNYDHYLSESHCYMEPGTKRQIDNGRVVSADSLTTTITNVDWEIIIRCYKFKAFKVYGMIRWGRGYLPRSIVQSVISYFQAKTQLKGVPGKEQEYMTAKENLNSIYGMMVMDPLRPEIPYDLEKNEWGKVVDGRTLLEVKLTDDEQVEALNNYNESLGRFTYYAWGVFITAYCRKNLWRGILHFGDDYVYADTDSIKVTNGDDPRHLEHIRKHNETIQRKIKECLTFHGLDPELSAAYTPTGKKKELGIWEYEGTYTRFKSLGAKRYMVEQDNPRTGGRAINITVSGVNKREAVPYIISRTAGPKRTGQDGGGDPFDFFEEGMIIPPGHAGKMIPYYGDQEIRGKLRDRDNVIYEYYEKSYEYMEPGGYCLSLSPTYVQYLLKLTRGLI